MCPASLCPHFPARYLTTTHTRPTLFAVAQRRLPLQEQVDSGALAPMLLRLSMGGTGVAGSMGGGPCQKYLGNMGRRPLFPKDKYCLGVYPCKPPFTLAGTSRQRRTRADAITAFYRRSRGGWVNGKEAVPTIWAEGPCFPKISAVVAFILADCRLSSREQVDSGGWGSTGGGSVASKRHVVTKMVPPTVAVTYTSAAMHHERAVASVEACA